MFLDCLYLHCLVFARRANSVQEKTTIQGQKPALCSESYYTKLYMVKDQGESCYTKAPSSLLQRSFNGAPSSSESSGKKELENTGPLFSHTKQPLSAASSIHTRQPLQTSSFCRCNILMLSSFFLMCNA